MPAHLPTFQTQEWRLIYFAMHGKEKKNEWTKSVCFLAGTLRRSQTHGQFSLENGDRRGSILMRAIDLRA